MMKYLLFFLFSMFSIITIAQSSPEEIALEFNLTFKNGIEKYSDDKYDDAKKQFDYAKQFAVNDSLKQKRLTVAIDKCDSMLTAIQLYTKEAYLPALNILRKFLKSEIPHKPALFYIGMIYWEAASPLQNKDSAEVYLGRAINLGYAQAKKELAKLQDQRKGGTLATENNTLRNEKQELKDNLMQFQRKIDSLSSEYSKMEEIAKKRQNSYEQSESTNEGLFSQIIDLNRKLDSTKNAALIYQTDSDGDYIPDNFDDCIFEGLGITGLIRKKTGCPKYSALKLELSSGVYVPFYIIKDNNNVTMPTKPITGKSTQNFYHYNAGLRFHWFRLQKWFALVGEIKLAQAGFATYNADKWVEKYNYLSVSTPVYIKLSTISKKEKYHNARFVTLLGAVASYNFQYKYTNFETGESRNNPTEINTNQYGLSGGLGVEFGKLKGGYMSFMAMGDYYMNSPLFNRNFILNNVSQYSNTTYKTLFNVGLGMSFRFW